MQSFIFSKQILLDNYKQFLFFERNCIYFNLDNSFLNTIKIMKTSNYKNFFILKKKLNSFIIGANRGYSSIVELYGLGFSATVKENNLLRLNIGFNHSIYYNILNEVLIKSKRKILFLYSHSFFLLRKVLVDLKMFRKLSPYKLKGIKEKDALYIKKN